MAYPVTHPLTSEAKSTVTVQFGQPYESFLANRDGWAQLYPKYVKIKELFNTYKEEFNNAKAKEAALFLCLVSNSQTLSELEVILNNKSIPTNNICATNPQYFNLYPLKTQSLQRLGTAAANLISSDSAFSPLFLHPGEDLSSNGKNLPVYSVADGRILNIGNYGAWKGIVYMEHEVKCSNKTTKYFYASYNHLKLANNISKNKLYPKNTFLGNITPVGTGPHLHFEIRANENYEKSNNPSQELPPVGNWSENRPVGSQFSLYQTFNMLYFFGKHQTFISEENFSEDFKQASNKFVYIQNYLLYKNKSNNQEYIKNKLYSCKNILLRALVPTTNEFAPYQNDNLNKLLLNGRVLDSYRRPSKVLVDILSDITGGTDLPYALEQ